MFLAHNEIQLISITLNESHDKIFLFQDIRHHRHKYLLSEYMICLLICYTTSLITSLYNRCRLRRIVRSRYVRSNVSLLCDHCILLFLLLQNLLFYAFYLQNNCNIAFYTSITSTEHHHFSLLVIYVFSILIYNNLIYFTFF